MRTTIRLFFVLGAGACLFPVSSAAEAPALALTIVVDAAKYDRMDTPVAVDAPVEFGQGRALRLVETTDGGRIPTRVQF
jgi:hypothetical protein